MRHSLKTMIALLIVISAIPARSADSAEVATVCKIVAEKDDKFRVIYQAPERKDVTIQLFDENNELVYTEDLKSEGFIKRYDLANLPVGSYQLKVESGKQSFSEKISLGDVSGFNLTFTPQNEREIAFVGSHVDGKSMTMFILDEADEVVYKENFSDTHQIHKKFNFESLKGEKVSFVLYHNDQLIKQADFQF